MIVRIQFVEKDKGDVIHSYSLFCVQGTWTLQTLFDKIKTGEVTCGRGIDLALYDNNVLASTLSCTKPPLTAELMPTPLEITLESLVCNHLNHFISPLSVRQNRMKKIPMKPIVLLYLALR